jgi:hypothetical protein
MKILSIRGPLSSIFFKIICSYLHIEYESHNVEIIKELILFTALLGICLCMIASDFKSLVISPIAYDDVKGKG